MRNWLDAMRTYNTCPGLREGRGHQGKVTKEVMLELWSERWMGVKPVWDCLGRDQAHSVRSLWMPFPFEKEERVRSYWLASISVTLYVHGQRAVMSKTQLWPREGIDNRVLVSPRCSRIWRLQLVLWLLVPLSSPLRYQASVFLTESAPQRQPELIGSGLQPPMLHKSGSAVNPV